MGAIGTAVIGFAATSMNLGPARLWSALVGLALLISVGMAFWHVGVEYGWWEGPKTCLSGGTSPVDIDPTTLLESLDDPFKMPACSEAAWVFLGISMAGWNALISLAAAVPSVLIRKVVT